MFDRKALLFLLSFQLSGCGVGQLFSMKVQTHATTVDPPSRVTVVVSAYDGKNPMDQLSESNFKIYEDGTLLDRGAIGLKLLPKTAEAAGLTILLLDLSGAPTPAELRRLQRGAAHFVEAVSVTQPVVVLAFDGSKRPREVARYAQVTQATQRPVPELSNFLSDDRSRDLNSALLSSIRGAKQELKASGKQAQFGTVVTLVRGPDLAGRTDISEVRQAIDESGFQFFSLSPVESPIDHINLVGKTERFEFTTIDTVPMRMTDLGRRVRAAHNAHYVLSYCSPARSGQRKLKIVAEMESAEGTPKRASTTSNFDSTGFQGGCNAEAQDAPGMDSIQLGKDADNQPSSEPGSESNGAEISGDQPGTEENTTNSADGPSRVVPPPDNGKYE